MTGGIPLQGTSGNLMDVTTTQEIKTQPSRVAPGYVEILSEKDSGSVTGSAYFKQIDSDEDYRVRAAVDTLMDVETFNYSAQNTSKHTYTNTTMVAAWSGGFMSTNSTGITTLSTGVKISTYKMFPAYGANDLWFEINASFTGTWGVTNTTIDFGGFIPGASLPYAPTDGAYFRANASGLFAVTNYNGTETVSTVLKASAGGANWSPTINQTHKFSISINQRAVAFWIDDTLMVEMPIPIATGTAFSAGAVPFAVRHAIAATAASAAVSFNVADYTVTYSGIPLIKEWPHQNASFGQCGYQGTSGNTMGSTASIANSTTPNAGAGSNTTALVTGLGGIGQMNAIASSSTDLIATSYQVPAGSAGTTGRTLYITGVSISAINYGAAVTGTATTLQWFLAFGHTAVSLATSETANTKAPRRVSIGAISAPATAAIGTVYGNGNPLTMQFLSPIPVNPGEYIASVVRQIVGTATASQTILFNVQFDCYWE